MGNDNSALWIGLTFFWMGIAISGGCAPFVTSEQLHAFLLEHPFFVSEIIEVAVRIYWAMIVQFKWWIIGLVSLRILVGYWNYKEERKKKGEMVYLK